MTGSKACAGLVAVISLFLALVWPASPVVFAQSGESAGASCHAMDAVFLVDQSDSMSGALGGPETATDPTGQRRYAVEAVIDMLTDMALDLCPDVIHRIAVVSYGTEVAVDLPLSEINPATSDEARTLRDRLKENVTAKEMGQTNPRLAFEKAAEILNNAAPLGEGVRKRVIIFVTDGMPCVGEACLAMTFPFYAYAEEMARQFASDFLFDATLLQQEACLDALRERLGPDEELDPVQVNDCLEEHQVEAATYNSSTYLWMVLLSFGGDYTVRLLRTYEQMTESHAGEVVLLSQNRQDIPVAFRGILEKLTGVRAARLECGNFAVNPYLDKARLILYKFDESIVVTLSYTDVNGQSHEISNGQGDSGFEMEEYYKQGANERYVLKRPYPGIWTLASENCDGLDAFYDPIAINPGGYRPNIPAEIAQRDRAPFYDTDQPYYLEYQMKDQAGDVIRQAGHPQFEVGMQMVVVDPAGAEKVYPTEWLSDRQLFRATGPLLVPAAGTYRIRVVGTAFRHEGEPAPVGDVFSEVFNSPYELFNQSAEFRVFPVSAFGLEILEPSQGQELKPIHGRLVPDSPPPILPIPVRARLVDRQGQPLLEVSRVLLDPPGALQAALSGDSEPVTLTLTPDPAVAGEFVGEFVNVGTAGELQLAVQLVGDFDPEYYPDSRHALVGFRRTDEVWNFDVITPAEGAVLAPIHGTIREGWPLTVYPIPIRVQVMDPSGEPYEETDPVMTYAPTALNAMVSAGDASALVSLVADPRIPGEYSGQVTGLDASGRHTLAVDLGLDYPGYFTPESNPAVVHFIRSDGLFNRPITYYALLALAILLVILRIWRYFAVRTNRVQGTLIFQDAGVTVAEFGLYSGKNWKLLKGRALKPYPQLGLKRLRVENQGKTRRRSQGQDDLLTEGTFGEGGIQVQGITLDGQRFTENLVPGLPGGYADSLFQMVFEPPG